MKLQEVEDDLHIDEDFKKVKYSLTISGHAFKILSKGLYSNPILAAIRELSCNAWDSHVAAGNDQPFEVCLPNSAMSVFAVRDFGTGLTPEQIDLVYRNYFTSTKQASDAMTGCFGLGSKSPFAYTQKFTTKSYVNGKCYTYVNILSAEGVPDLVKVSEEDSTEPTGVEVSFHVNPKDRDSFEEEAHKALRVFKTRPIIKGIYDLKSFWNETEPVLTGDGWALGKYGFVAVMGNVAYPMNWTGVTGFSTYANAARILSPTVEFPIGAFEITPSRESIQWSEFSIKAVNDRLEEVFEQIKMKFNAQLEGLPNMWEASKFAKRMYEKIPSLHSAGIRLVFNGQAIDYRTGFQVPDGFRLVRYTTCDGGYRNGKKSPQSVSSETHGNILPGDYSWWIADAKGYLTAFENHMRGLPMHSKAFVVFPIVKEPDGEDYYKNPIFKEKISFEPADVARLPAFFTGLGIDVEPKKLSEVEKPERAKVERKRSRLTGTKARAFKFIKARIYGTSDEHWEETEVDLSKPGLYVEISAWRPVTKCLGPGPQNIYGMIENFAELGVTFPEIIGVRTAEIEKFNAAEPWEELEDFCKRELRRVWDETHILQMAFDMDRTPYGERVQFEQCTKVLRDFPELEGTLFGRTAVQMHNILALEKHVDAFRTLYHKLANYENYAIRTQSYNSKGPFIDYIVEQYERTFPLLSRLNYFDEEVVEYIKLINEKKGS